ncbi:DUF3413 domain-containing protein [Aliidiomarina maris]|uniref:Alkaline phosphatase n=1 Tax=Aliidiomarina maris TaxID=531312 RepID=A0A327WXR2_9GAMM|nr:DUF3413 domain-containing protein [Aliidiomarina maris]RAJ96459.1 hypothetical protein B0I24_10837 [Aliidiomarina maris]RUO23788.1 alkaline phosphatase [Aliidiomarina maris]
MGKYQKRDRISRLISWGHWFTFTNILLCLLIGVLYIETMGSTGTILGDVYLVLNWFGHFAFLPFVFFILLLFPLCLILPYSKILRGAGAIIASFGIFILLFDALFFRQYGFHLNTYSLAQMARDAESIFAGASFVGLLAVMFSFLVILTFQITLANLTWKRLERLRGHRIGPRISAVFVACFLASHLIHIWADANIYTPITQQDDLLPLSYPSTAKTLMARHGWIGTDTYQSQRDRLTESDQLNLQYPLGSLLCTRQPNLRPTLVVAFDALTPAQQRQLSQITQLRALADTAVGHTDLNRGVFELVYSLPDIYYAPIQREAAAPAYQSTLEDYGHQVRFLHSVNWPLEQVPASIAPQLSIWPTAQHADQSMSILLASQADFNIVLTAVRSAIRQQHRVIVTAITPASDLTAEQQQLPTIWREFVVPMWGANLSAPYVNAVGVEGNTFAQIGDVMPTALSGYITCADDFRAFASGRDLSQADQRLPRVHSVNSRFYIFEAEQTTILERNGDTAVYNHNGELRPGATPPTPVLINSLQELQRFSRSR